MKINDVVILAAGAGRRFADLKQFTSVTSDGATLLELTLRDSRRAGCTHAVIVVAQGHEEKAQALLAARPVTSLEISCVVQRPDDLPAASRLERDRPWGTAQALWAVRDAVTGPFLCFNADDYYGPNAPAALAAALADDEGQSVFAMLSYTLGSTLSPEGTVSRAVCETDDSNRLVSLHEYLDIDGGGRIASGPDTGLELPLDAPVSMNAWAFTPDIFPLLEAFLRDFLKAAPSAQDECLLPDAIDAAVRTGEIEVRVATAIDRWSGMTWPGDRQRVARHLAEQAAPCVAAKGFGLDVADAAPVPFGSGLIHSTWLLDATEGPHLLQKLNAGVFPDPAAMAENAAAAAVRIDDALRRRGGDDPRHRLVYRRSPDGRPWLRDSAGDIWRASVLIPGSRPADPGRPDEVRAAARVLGEFPGLVADGAGPVPIEILPGFHDTQARFAALKATANADANGRLADCRAEVDRLIGLAPLADRLPVGSLPVRLVHNDAKLDNVLVDASTGEALCVIDLDTVMPGLAVHDFGDLVRSAVSGCPEDEPDLDRIAVREETFNDLSKGYLEGAAGWIEDTERSRLVDGAVVITYEQALRFLADYLAGDTYFPVVDAGHNLRRARAQLHLLEELLSREEELQNIVNSV